MQHAYAMLAITIFACCPGSFNILSLVGWLCGGGGGGGGWVKWGHLGLHIIVTSFMANHHEFVAYNISLQRDRQIFTFSFYWVLTSFSLLFLSFFFYIPQNLENHTFYIKILTRAHLFYKKLFFNFLVFIYD